VFPDEDAPAPGLRLHPFFYWEGYRESRRCSRDTDPESYITKYTLVYEDQKRTKANLVEKWENMKSKLLAMNEKRRGPGRSYIETLIIYKLGSRKFTTKNDLY